MKFLKGFFKVIITIILVGLITTLATTTYLKKIFTEDFIVKYLQEELGKEITEVITIEIPEVKGETLERIRTQISENEKITGLSKTLTEQVLQDAVANKIDTKETKQKIKDLILENKSIIEQELGKQVTKEQLDEVLNNIDSDAEFDKWYQEIIIDTKSGLTQEGTTLIKLYNWIGSANYYWLFIGFITLCLLCIALLKKSYYQWLLNAAIASIVSAVITALICLAFGGIMNLVLSDISLNTNVRIDIGSLLMNAGTVLLIGIICLITYFLTKKNALPKETVS